MIYYIILLTTYYYVIYFAGMYGNLFKGSSGAAFSHFRTWEAVGYILAFGYQSHLCLPIKAYILLVVLWLGMICYGIVERKEYKNRKADESNEN